MQYLKRESLARQYDLSPRTVDNRIKEMVESGRYPENFLVKDTGLTLVEEAAFFDYLFYRRMLKTAPKLVPKYLRAETPEAYVIRREIR